VAWLSVLSNSTLMVGKIIVGLAIGSVSVLSEAIHSGIDLLAAIIALMAVKTSSKPADADHPFGHGKFENISGAVEALLIFFAAAWIIFEAVNKLLSPKPLGWALWGVLVMAVSTLVNLTVSHFLFKVGKETTSVALMADAWHLRTDVYTSAGVMIALALLWLAGRFAPDWKLPWVDPAAALLVALLILKAAYDLTIQAARDLLDVRLPAEEEEWLVECIKNLSPSVKGFHRLRTRRAGALRFVEFHLMVDPLMTVVDSHRLTDQATERIRDKFPQTSVLAHIEPCEGECAPACVEGCQLCDEERDSKRRTFHGRS
jgi:cation diffusion facilitator family transporter